MASVISTLWLSFLAVALYKRTQIPTTIVVASEPTMTVEDGTRAESGKRTKKAVEPMANISRPKAFNRSEEIGVSVRLLARLAQTAPTTKAARPARVIWKPTKVA